MLGVLVAGPILRFLVTEKHLFVDKNAGGDKLDAVFSQDQIGIEYLLKEKYYVTRWELLTVIETIHLAFSSDITCILTTYRLGPF
jgi:hypothetical protein